jgi:hypothetical protein
MGYSGLVRATQHCHWGGFRYSAGQVFTVTQVWLHPQDPFEPVRFVGHEATVLVGPERAEHRESIYVRLSEPLIELNRRGNPATDTGDT